MHKMVSAIRSAGAISLRKAYKVTTMSNKVRIMGMERAISRLFLAVGEKKTSTECAKQGPDLSVPFSGENQSIRDDDGFFTRTAAFINRELRAGALQGLREQFDHGFVRGAVNRWGRDSQAQDFAMQRMIFPADHGVLFGVRIDADVKFHVR